MRSHQAFLCALVSTLALSGCGSTDKNGSAVGPLAAKTELEGTWHHYCVNSSGIGNSYRESFEIEGAAYTGRLTYFTEKDCTGDLSLETVSHGTIELREGKLHKKELVIDQSEVLKTAYSVSAVQNANELNFCNRRDWQAGVPKACPDSSEGEYRYTIIEYRLEGDTLRISSHVRSYSAPDSDIDRAPSEPNPLQELIPYQRVK